MNSFAEAFGFNLTHDPPPTDPHIDQWYFVQLNATAEGALAQFEITIPAEAVFVTPGILRIAYVELIPLILPDQEFRPDLWAYVTGWHTSSCMMLPGNNEESCALVGSRFEYTETEGYPGDPRQDHEVIRRPNMEPEVHAVVLRNDADNETPLPHRFVSAVRSNREGPFGLLMRIREAPSGDEYGLPKKPGATNIDNVSGDVILLHPFSEGSGIIYARFDGSDSFAALTPDITTAAETTTSLTPYATRISSSSDMSSGWGRVRILYQDETLSEWSLEGRLRGEPVQEEGIGLSHDVDLWMDAAGSDPTDLELYIGRSNQEIRHHIIYEHIDIGMPMDRWLA